MYLGFDLAAFDCQVLQLYSLQSKLYSMEQSESVNENTFDLEEIVTSVRAKSRLRDTIMSLWHYV